MAYTSFPMTLGKERFVGKCLEVRFPMTLGKERFVGKCLEVSDTWQAKALERLRSHWKGLFRRALPSDA